MGLIFNLLFLLRHLGPERASKVVSKDMTFRSKLEYQGYSSAITGEAARVLHFSLDENECDVIRVWLQ